MIYCTVVVIATYLDFKLVSDSVLFNDILPQIEKVLSIVHVDVGTCHPSMCEIPVVSSCLLHAHILNIR